MSPIPWDQETVLQFIHLYGKERVLWDKSFSGNKKNFQEAWERVQEAMNVECTIDELKRKKESLMTAFRIHCKRAKSDPDYECSWFAYRAMYKYLGHIYVDNKSEDTWQEEEVYISTPKSEESNDKIYFCVPDEKVSDRDDEPTPAKRKIKLEPKKPSYIYMPSPKDADMSSTQDVSSITKLDECELYGQLLIKKLRKLNENQRDIAMLEIDNIMYKIKMRRSTSTNHQSVFVVAQGNQNGDSDSAVQLYEQNPL